MHVPHRQTELVKINPENIDQKMIKHLAEIVRAGGVVAFPTETVYGLGANAFDALAIRKIFQAKGRPADNPLIVHISDMDMMAQVTAQVPEKAQKLIAAFWPGPLTIVLPKSPKIPGEVTAGLDTVGIRMPDHNVALALIAAAGVPIAAPSANISGKPSTTSAKHVAQDLAGKVEAIIDGGQTKVGLESTVIDLTTEIPTVLRPGGISIEELERVLGEIKYDLNLLNPEQAPRSPGMKYTHYAPDAELFVVEGELVKSQAKIKELADLYRLQGKKVAILASDETANYYNDHEIISVGSRKNLNQVAAKLFDTLRKFDERGIEVIISEGFATKGIGVALMNRLRKAAGFHIIKV